MLGFLSLVNQFLGYFNFNTKLKNRLFTIVGFFANFYFLYAAVLAFQNGRFRWILFVLLFLLLLYFSVLNFLYYFTDKTTKWDISPKVEQLLGGPPQQATADQRAARMVKQPVVPAAGLFNDQHVLPSTLVSSPEEQATIDQFAQTLVQNGYLSLNYDGLSDREIYAEAHKTAKPFYALGQAGVQLPYYTLKFEGRLPVVYAGMNSMDAKPVGHLTAIGMTSVREAEEKFNLALANAYITGGPYKIAGRSGIVEGSEPYAIAVQVAYQEK
ncbi:hypothetical protein IV38_GL001638 [Lactobacillus selangorensis]|uniref:Uncharacterized protein n=1 Tax=Lactobacillus selangorensis TaxID=81857 RepID=A0A0R2FHR7_9LACO|nr:DUF6681 family protein [Lactobacillus selangorensis]KRN28185.1 hypothetical protein IV38_GL001638 [Lactobacillus selangorensis]KRN30939.1 hypothetical protein IV40_GL001577 [Lactobacillus selangorensis]